MTTHKKLLAWLENFLLAETAVKNKSTLPPGKKFSR